MKDSICTTCGYVGKPIKLVKGSFAIELFLWLCFFVPGFIYSIWRLTSKIDVCPKCKNPNMIPIDSPVGQKLVGEHQHPKA